jgi:F-type H+-transporting ATPase subunit delta
LKAVAQRYAAALTDVALAQGIAEQTRRELTAFAGLYAESADLRNFLSTPAISRANKQAVIEKLALRIGASKIVRNFLFVLADQRRTAELPEILQVFEAELRAREGVAEAQVTSVGELSAGEKDELTRALAKLTGKKIEARYAVDTALLGGAMVRIGTTIYDGSVRSQLDRMREKLASE